jgi:hypothetical protein
MLIQPIFISFNTVLFFQTIFLFDCKYTIIPSIFRILFYLKLAINIAVFLSPFNIGYILLINSLPMSTLVRTNTTDNTFSLHLL